MIVGLGDQQASATVGLAEAGPTKVGPYFHQDPTTVGPELLAGSTYVGYCCQQDLAAVSPEL